MLTVPEQGLVDELELAEQGGEEDVPLIVREDFLAPDMVDAGVPQMVILAQVGAE